MTPFQKMFEQIRHEAMSPKHLPLFDAARKRHAALERYGSVVTVVGLLGNQDPAQIDRKAGLFRAFIIEQQAQPSPLWTSLSLLACFPFLARLRARIVADDMPPDELDQLVMMAFVDVVATFPTKRHTDLPFLRVRRETEHKVFRQIAQRRRELSMEQLTDPSALECLGEPPLWHETEEDGKRREASESDEIAAAVSLLVEHGSDVLDANNFELVTSTPLCGRTIRSYVQSQTSDLSADEVTRLRDNAKRRHSRAIARLRKKMADRTDSRVPA